MGITISELEKAIKWLKGEYETKDHITREQAYSYVDLAVLALEKQIPKKMKLEINKNFRCPNCIALYENPQNDGILYCACCGQTIDWSVKE